MTPSLTHSAGVFVGTSDHIVVVQQQSDRVEVQRARVTLFHLLDVFFTLFANEKQSQSWI